MKNKIIKYGVYTVFIIGLMLCITLLFPQVRQMVIELVERILHKQTGIYNVWSKSLLFYAMGGIFFIAFLGYCLLTVSGKMFMREVWNSLTEINWRSFTWPVLLMFGVYLLGIISIIRANFLCEDDIGRSVDGYRGWYDWSRYVSQIFSILVHADFRLTDISPLPQILAIFLLTISSVLLVYILNDKKITTASLLASVPVGFSPYMLECLSYKFDAPYIAMSVLASIVPFLFLARKKVFMFFSVISLLVMCMTYQAASGIYLLVTLVLGFNDWNGKRKTNREVLLFLGQAALSFCTAMVIFKLFLMKPYSTYVSNAMLPLPQILSGTLFNFQNYVNTLSSDFGFIWKAIIGIVFCFFIAKSVYTSAQNKMISFIFAVVLLSLLFILSYGAYLVLEHPLFAPRALYGFGVLLGIVSISISFNFNKIAKISALALSWCFFVFTFSYGNALADQKRYVNFRAGLLLQDLSVLYPYKDENKITIQLKNTIGFTPVVKNIAKHNPVIYRLVPQMMKEDDDWANFYYLVHFNYAPFITANIVMNSVKSDEPYVDFTTLDFPVVKKTYYHTIRSDGKRILVELHDGLK